MLSQPPPLPTSHNFTKQRDKMRHKLEEKGREKEQNRHCELNNWYYYMCRQSDFDSRGADIYPQCFLITVILP